METFSIEGPAEVVAVCFSGGDGVAAVGAASAGESSFWGELSVLRKVFRMSRKL